MAIQAGNPLAVLLHQDTLDRGVRAICGIAVIALIKRHKRQELTIDTSVRAPEQPLINGFLELSILDSGPGMAAKWLKRSVEDLNPKEQLAAILQCFGKGRTTTGAPGRGFGLWKVLLSLHALRGFISVRTNSVHVYRQFGYFSNNGLEEMGDGQKIPKEQLLDWRRGLSPESIEYPHVKGTVVSFLLPMGDA